jgi:hypothetical protein
MRLRSLGIARSLIDVLTNVLPSSEGIWTACKGGGGLTPLESEHESSDDAGEQLPRRALAVVERGRHLTLPSLCDVPPNCAYDAANECGDEYLRPVDNGAAQPATFQSRRKAFPQAAQMFRLKLLTTTR